MAIPLSKYKEIKNNYAIGYFGHNINIVKSVQDNIKKDKYGLNIFIVLEKDMYDKLENKQYCIKLEDFDKNNTAYYRNLDCLPEELFGYA